MMATYDDMMGQVSQRSKVGTIVALKRRGITARLRCQIMGKYDGCETLTDIETAVLVRSDADIETEQ